MLSYLLKCPLTITSSYLANSKNHIFITYSLSSVQLLSCVQLFATLWATARQASLSITNLRSLLKLMSIESVMPSSHLILCCPFSCLQFSQHQGLFKWVSSSHQVTKVLEFQLQHQSFQWLISFKINWFDLLEVQGTLKNLLQHHSSKASILQHSAFFRVQLTYIHDYWKNHSLD